MTNDESAAAFERLSQAIALAEGFQLLVLELGSASTWGLHLLFDDVKARVAELLGVPPFVIIYSRLTAGETFNEDVIAPFLQLSLPDRSDTRLVAVIDVLRPFEPKRVRGMSSDESAFRQLLRGLNERRNTIMQRFTGTLVFGSRSGMPECCSRRPPT